MAVLLLAEVTDGALSMDATAKVVTAAKQLGDVTVLACGGSAAAAGKAAATIEGVSKVLVAEDASLGHRLAEIDRRIDRVTCGRLRTYRCPRDHRRQKRNAPCRCIAGCADHL